MPMWRVLGYGKFRLGSETFRFYDVASPLHQWWARRASMGAWEREALDFYARSVRPGDIIFDIGAYIGPYTLLGSRLVGPSGHVYAFEPDPVARKVLERNIAANGAANVTVVPRAIAAEEGVGWLTSTHLGDAASFLSSEHGDAQVDITTLRGFCELNSVQPDVIKIDVEGGEAGVLSDDAAGIVQEARVVMLELHEAALRRHGLDPEMLLKRGSVAGKRLVEIERRPEFEGNYIIGLL